MRRRSLTAAVAALLFPIAAGAQEHRAQDQEPYADAPGVTPITDALRATAEAREHSVRLSGFFRTRADLGVGWDLNRGPTPLGASIWPAPYVDGGQSRTQTNLDMRLRLDVAAEVGYGVSLHGRLHVLDNLRYGSLPDADLSGVAVNQRSPSQPIDVRQLYGQVLLPFGVLTAGRMGALIDWGTGFFANAGNGLDDDYGDVGDRIALTVPALGLLWSALYEITASGPGSDAVRPEIRPIFDLDPRDDARTAAFSLARWDTPASRNRKLAAGRSFVNFGVVAAYRTQANDLAPGATPAARAVIHRDLQAIVADGWIRADLGRATLEAELAYVGFSIGNASLDPAAALNVAITGRQLGGVVRAEWRHSPRLFARMEFGFASGDDHPGTGARTGVTSTAQPGDLDGPQFDLSATPRDSTLNNFRFHPNYRVDLILWRRIIGTVTDAFYLRPMVRYRLGPMFTLEAAEVVSGAMAPNSTLSGERMLGAETDVGLVYEQEHGFVARLDYGLLVPLGGFRNVPRAIDPSIAHALHLVMAFRY